MSEAPKPPAPPSRAEVEAAWAARAVVDPAQLDDARLHRHRHSNERRALLTIVSIIACIELLLVLMGPERRDAIEASLHWVPKGVLGPIMNALHPGGVAGPVLIFLLATALLDLFNHWLQRVGTLAEATEVTPLTLPGLYTIVEELRGRFGLPPTRVFVSRGAPQSYSLGLFRPYLIVVPIAWLGTLTDDELRFVIGHEMGHIKLGHTRVAPFLGGSDFSAGGPISILFQIRSLILSSYQQAQELSADRIGVVASRGVGPAISASIKTGLGTLRGGRLDVAALAPQAAEVHHGRLALANNLRQFGKAQPSLFFRLKELVAWAGLPPEAPPPAAAPAAAPASTPAAPPAARPR
jgi:Zn-dependent protease with chaperone function